MVKVAVLIAGLKGLHFLQTIEKACEIICVSSYEVKGMLDESYIQIKQICIQQDFKFVDKGHLKPSDLLNADLIFVIGWQYIITNVDNRFIVFHDSLLPKYRGFSPTITALISGDTKIGVSALQPVDSIDAGPIYAQRSINITYPVKVKVALDVLSECYNIMGLELIAKYEQGLLTATPQNEALATYSIWRDEDDYIIDWNKSSEEICRFVDAVGWPYQGAVTWFENQRIIIDDVLAIPDLVFNERHIGKVWSIKDGIPEVVCGKGIVRILSARTENNHKVTFSKLRTRLSNKLG